MMPDPEHWYGLSVAGCISRSVVDTALFLDVASGPAAGDRDTPPPPPRTFVECARSAPGRLRIAVSTRPVLPVSVRAEVRGAVHETAELLRSLGHDVRERDPDYGLVGNSLIPRYIRGVRDDAARMAKPRRLERRTRGYARIGRLFPDGTIARVRVAEAEHAARIGRIFDDHDVLLTATTAGPPVEVGRWEGLGAVRTLLGMALAYPFTGVWNALGWPAAAVPAGFTAGGLPLSVQIVGRRNDEATLLSLAAQMESERPWADKWPPVS
jgi:amidase